MVAAESAAAHATALHFASDLLEATAGRQQPIEILQRRARVEREQIDVIEVQDFRDGESVDRELVLMRVTISPDTRAEIMQVCDIFRAKIVDVQPSSLTIEVTGDEGKVEKFIELMQAFGVQELTRTGKVALARK